jgi:excinuclease UvrABC nuclease subunit
MEIDKYLNQQRQELLKKDNWSNVTLTRGWTSFIPSKAGVYVLRHNNELVYVGETGNLRKRMNDLLDSRHHTLRRTIGQRFFGNHKKFIPATTKRKFPLEIEALVNEHISQNLEIAYLSVSLGRKELEELIEQEIRNEIKLNKRGKRKA